MTGFHPGHHKQIWRQCLIISVTVKREATGVKISQQTDKLGGWARSARRGTRTWMGTQI